MATRVGVEPRACNHGDRKIGFLNILGHAADAKKIYKQGQTEMSVRYYTSSSLVWTIMHSVCPTTPTQKGPVCSHLSGLTTTTGRLLGPYYTYLEKKQLMRKHRLIVAIEKDKSHKNKMTILLKGMIFPN